MSDVQKSGTRPVVTIVVTPRERFGVARQSLENIYETTPEPFDLIYVDARSPADLSDWIADQSQQRGFTHVKLDHFVSPNEARNIGIKLAKTPYVVFYDNDVIATPGWLTPLVQCTEEEGAAVVAPLICEGNPLHQRIHQAGGYFTKDVQGFFQHPKRRSATLSTTCCCRATVCKKTKARFAARQPKTANFIASSPGVTCLTALGSWMKACWPPRNISIFA